MGDTNAQLQKKLEEEMKKSSKLNDKLDFIKKKEIEDKEELRELIEAETRDFIKSLQTENENLKCNFFFNFFSFFSQQFLLTFLLLFLSIIEKNFYNFL